MESTIDFYKDRIAKVEKELQGIRRSYNIVSILRLITIISACFFVYYCYTKSSIFFGVILFILHIVLFIALADLHDKLSIKKREHKEFIKLNEDEIKRINGQWREFQDKGEEYLNVNHPFINDLDIFGQNSLFQWVNNTRTVYGREKLKKLLILESITSRESIVERQESLQELAKKIDFRQKLLIALKVKKSKKGDESFLSNWVKERADKVISTKITVLRIGVPVINILLIVLSFIGIIPWQILILDFAICFFIVGLIGKEVQEGLVIFEELKDKIKTYVNGIEAIENEDFTSKQLKSIQKQLKGQGKWASHNLRELENITTWLYDRGNAFYILLNCILLWDYQMVYRLEKWRRKNSNDFNVWMESLGEFEALTSLSTLIFNNPNWCVPEISEDNILQGQELAHPMLGEKAVGNSFNMDSNSRVLLITGSNMSGKSTFLRTIGFSVVLSYLGLNVKGSKFITPILNIYTCMRTGDNLEESISSFYAEILRIKSIVDGTKRGEKILFLLDEIFKGTNSLDRHLGAQVLIDQLLKGNTMGLVSTHDLELCEMEKENKNISNYNFREYYENNKLKFDYKIREGVSKTRNAKYLMKMAGIDIE